MLVNLSNISEDYSKIIGDALGNKFTFSEIKTLVSSNSRQLQIDSLSEQLNSIIKIEDNSVYFGNIGLLESGIILTITNELKKFAWIVLYRDLTINNKNRFTTINGLEGNFVKFKNLTNIYETNTFFKKLSILKIKNSLENSDN